jgi:hypothetical protein
MKLKAEVIMIDTLSFTDTVDRVLSGNVSRDSVLQLGSTPQIYLPLGLPDLQLIMTQGVLRKVISKHNLTITLIKRLPALLNSPIMILRSATEKGSVVAVLDALDLNGCFVIAAIHPDRKHKQHKVNILASIYGKSRLGWFDEQIKAGRLLYSDKEKTQRLSQSAWLQLPREVIDAEHDLIISSNQPEVKNNHHYKPILTLKNKGSHENK